MVDLGFVLGFEGIPGFGNWAVYMRKMRASYVKILTIYIEV